MLHEGWLPVTGITHATHHNQIEIAPLPPSQINAGLSTHIQTERRIPLTCPRSGALRHA